MNKSIFQSKTIQGILVAIIAFILNKVLHSHLAPSDAQLSDIITNVAQLMGMIYAFYGRIKAEISANAVKHIAWYKSQTLLSLIGAATIVLLQMFGINVTDILGIKTTQDSSQLVNNVAQSFTMIGAFVGRLKATAIIK